MAMWRLFCLLPAISAAELAVFGHKVSPREKKAKESNHGVMNGKGWRRKGNETTDIYLTSYIDEMRVFKV